MSVLTKNERDGLEDVYLSIHTNQDKLKKIKDISSLIILKGNELSIEKLLKQVKYGIKETKFSQFLVYLGKKKKNLSK
jgi:hypothetical protein